MFGDTVPYAPPWTGAGLYDNYTNDLTDDPAFSCAIGFTHDEAEALGRAMSIDLASRIAPACPDGDHLELPSPMVYSAADVLSVAHALLSDDTPDVGRQAVEIYLSPPEPGASSDFDESVTADYYLPIEDDTEHQPDAAPDDENALPPTAPSSEAKYLDGSDYETLWYAFVGSKYPNAKPPPDIDLEKLARITARANPTVSSSTQGCTRAPGPSTTSESSKPPAIPTEDTCPEGPALPCPTDP